MIGLGEIASVCYADLHISVFIAVWEVNSTYKCYSAKTILNFVFFFLKWLVDVAVCKRQQLEEPLIFYFYVRYKPQLGRYYTF